MNAIQRQGGTWVDHPVLPILLITCEEGISQLQEFRERNIGNALNTQRIPHRGKLVISCFARNWNRSSDHGGVFDCLLEILRASQSWKFRDAQKRSSFNRNTPLLLALLACRGILWMLTRCPWLATLATAWALDDLAIGGAA